MQVTREKQDIVEKEFIGFPDIAADTINVLLYKGRQLTRAEDLRAGTTETVYPDKDRRKDAAPESRLHRRSL